MQLFFYYFVSLLGPKGVLWLFCHSDRIREKGWLTQNIAFQGLFILSVFGKLFFKEFLNWITNFWLMDALINIMRLLRVLFTHCHSSFTFRPFIPCANSHEQTSLRPTCASLMLEVVIYSMRFYFPYKWTLISSFHAYWCAPSVLNEAEIYQEMPEESEKERSHGILKPLYWKSLTFITFLKKFGS